MTIFVRENIEDNMEEEKKLYPMRILPIVDEYNWGSEEFKLADLGYRDSLVAEGWLAANNISEIMDMYMDRVVGDAVFETYGRQFPFEIKYLKVKGKLPLMVHPADELAAQRYDFLGKEKFWYVVRAGKDASLMLGWKKDTNAGEVYDKCLDGSVADILNIVAPIPGQAYRIAPGTVHAACGDIEIAEVSQSSPLDFCLCGWGEPVSPDQFDENLNLVDALDFINYKKSEAATLRGTEQSGGALQLVKLPQFSVNKIKLIAPLKIQADAQDTPVCYLCLKGEANIEHTADAIGSVNQLIKEGQTVLVPAEIDSYSIAPTKQGTELLEILVEPFETQDPYINPDAAPQLDDDEQ